MHAVVRLVWALVTFNPLATAALAVALVLWAARRLLRFAEDEARRRPLFTAWLLWHWSRRRR